MSAEFVNLLVFGFIHELEKQSILFMLIPTEIYQTIISFYPILARFELYDSRLYELLDDGYGIRGLCDEEYTPKDIKDIEGCEGYTIFAEVLIADGYKKGIHFWSVKLIGKEMERWYCYHNIGVIANERDVELLCKPTNSWPENIYENDTTTSCLVHYKSSDHDVVWPKGVVITVKLNCDEGYVEYYRDNEFFRKDQIDRNLSYFFALNSCALNDNYFQVVDTPNVLFK